MSKLDGKVAIMTGSGRGIGRAIALKLAAEGASVIINDLDEAPAQEVLAELEARGHAAHAVVGDVTAADFGDRLVAETLDKFGSLDIIVNNAGYIWNTAIQNHTDEQWYAMLDVHATAPFRILRAAASYFREAAKREKGAIKCRKVVNVSSLSGVYGAATQLAYSAGKAAVIGMTNLARINRSRHRLSQRSSSPPCRVAPPPLTIPESDNELSFTLQAKTQFYPELC